MTTRCTIFQLFDSEYDRAKLGTGFLPLDNTACPRPDWREYYPIRKFLLSGGLKEKDSYYGFLTPKFSEMTGINSELVNAFIASSKGLPDLIAFSPLSDMQAFFQNTFEQGEFFCPGLLASATDIAARTLPNTDLRTLVMDSGSSIFCNYFIAKPKFWRRWLAINEVIYKLAEEDQSSLGHALRQQGGNAEDGAQLKVHLMERTASLLLAAERGWRSLVMDPFRLPSSGLDLFKSGYGDSVTLDALKTAYLRNAFPEFIQRFNELRASYFVNQRPVFLTGQPVKTPSEPSDKENLPSIKELLAQGNSEKVLVVAHRLAEQNKLELVDLIEVANLLDRCAMKPASIGLYQTWLKATSSPLKFVANFNMAVLLSDERKIAEAELSYRAALTDNPNFTQARLNLATTLERLKRPHEAIAELSQTLVAIEAVPNPDKVLHLHALNNLGRILEQERRYPEAEDALERSLAVDPQQPKVIWHWVHLRQKQCKWPAYKPVHGLSESDLIKNSSALALLAGTGDPLAQLEAAKAYAFEKIPKDLPQLAPMSGYTHDRLRIGYLSSNFGMHAVSLLTAELYELHNRDRVEVYAYCWSPEDVSPLRARVIQAMDHFTRIAELTDAEAAAAIRADEIDILVDLQGLTSGCRPIILAHRPAPTQITYLGFPGTTGLPCIDYVLADRYVLPDELLPYFSEKPLYLPVCFQINDRKRIPSTTPSRQACGLPDDAFVFCAFNNNYKFTAELFAVWMRILVQTPNSVLWLLADNETARQNLANEATRLDIDQRRLIFAPRAALQDYWARYAQADLFLDTLPFNGGTTASDALWMGVPVLTCSGRTFASRMAGSLLQAVGLPDLVTHNLADYEKLAVRIGTDSTFAANLKMRLKDGRETGALFDSPRFVRDLEGIFEQVAVRLAH